LFLTGDSLAAALRWMGAAVFFVAVPSRHPER